MGKKPGRDIESLASEAGMHMTEQRRVITRVLSDATDHPMSKRFISAPRRKMRQYPLLRFTAGAPV